MPTRCETCVVSIVLRSAGGRQLDIGVLPIGFESGGIGRQRLTPTTVLPSKTTPSRMISIGASGQGRSRRIHRPPARNTVPQAIQKPLSFRSICQRANSAVRMRAPTPRRNHPQGTSASIEIPTQMKKTAHATESSCRAWSLVSVDDLGPKAGCVLVIALSLFQKRAIAVRALTCVNSGIGNTGLGPSESPRTKFAAVYRLWIPKTDVGRPRLSLVFFAPSFPLSSCKDRPSQPKKRGDTEPKSEHKCASLCSSETWRPIAILFFALSHLHY